MSKQHFAGGPIWRPSPLQPRCLPPPLSFPKERQREIGTRRVENPNSYVVGLQGGREGGRDRGAGLRLLPPPPAVPPPSGCEPGRRQAAGGCGAGRVSPGAQERESRGARGPAARPGLAASPPGTAAAAAAAAPAASQQSVRLLLQLPRVEGLRGKARRREGRGGMKAAWSLPRGGGRGVMRGCTEPPLPRSATRPHKGRQPAGQWRKGELESLES